MNTAERLIRAIRHPKLFLRGINRLYHRSIVSTDFNPHGIDVFDEDWDVLTILDACRFDMFEQHANLPGTLQFRRSKASATGEFLRANLHRKDLRDTVYVTANPQLWRNREDIEVEFFETVEVWRDAGWDDDEGTVLPETTTQYAIKAAERCPDKRLIVHYMQPHYPFIESRTAFDKGHLTAPEQDHDNVWDQMLFGTLDRNRDEIWSLYNRNLQRTLPHVHELLKTIEGKHVVTADHGNMVGERAFPLPFREWGHPRGIYTEQLVKVPWHIYVHGQRRNVTVDQPRTKTKEIDKETVEDRLADLGYVN